MSDIKVELRGACFSGSGIPADVCVCLTHRAASRIVKLEATLARVRELPEMLRSLAKAKAEKSTHHEIGRQELACVSASLKAESRAYQHAAERLEQAIAGEGE